MSWAVGHDLNWKRDVGYGVPATCDLPDCGKTIDRGLAYVCGGEPFGGDAGCGLYFCEGHLRYGDGEHPLCPRCIKGEEPFDPTPDTARWLEHKLTDPSWEPWREANPEQVEAARLALATRAENHSTSDDERDSSMAMTDADYTRELENALQHEPATAVEAQLHDVIRETQRRTAV